ncbi:MAG: dihydropteroate synthase [Planctomycetota bacterium]
MSEPILHPSQRAIRPATRWRLRSRTLSLGRRPLIMGIVNVTPDSFSDGGRYYSTDDAVVRALQLDQQGADLLDIGGESTRPYSEPVETEEELSRVTPVIERVARETSTPISIDTSKAAVAESALAVGAEVVNDVTGLEGDPGMAELIAEAGAGVCVMHMRGTPQTMQDDPRYHDVVAEVSGYLSSRRDALTAAGIETDRICLDPGIGFGKTHEHNGELMAGCWRLHALGCPLLVGHSRKAFLGKLIGDKHADRTLATVGAALALAVQGVQVIRVHDVRQLREAWAAFATCGGQPSDRSRR